MDELTIKTVARMTQLSEFTLRAWEKRYGVVTPRRLPSGHRVYDASDIEKLKLVKTLIGQGHQVGLIAGLTLAQLKKLQARVESSVGRYQSQVQTLLRLLAEFDLPQFTVFLRGLQLQFDTRVFLIEIVAPFLNSVGREVVGGELDIFHEHAASAILRNTLSGILYLTEQALDISVSPSIVLSTPEHDAHEFGILICAILAMLNGHRVLYLGPNLPAASVVKACETVKTPLLVLGIAASEAHLSSETLSGFMTALDRSLPRTTGIWYGGERAAEMKSLRSARGRKLVYLEDLQSFERSLRRVVPR